MGVLFDVSTLSEMLQLRDLSRLPVELGSEDDGDVLPDRLLQKELRCPGYLEIALEGGSAGSLLDAQVGDGVRFAKRLLNKQ